VSGPFPTTGQEATMSTARRIFRPTLACVLLTVAMTSTAAASGPQDLRDPDNRAVAAAPAQDLRSPDTRDPAAGGGTFEATDAISPQVITDRQRALVERFKRSPSYHEALREAASIAELPQPVPVRSDDGIDWGDAGIGAGSLLGVIALGLAGAMTIVHRRRRGHRTATVA
jgi:hypothetical protein